MKTAKRGIAIVDSTYKGTRSDIMKTLLNTTRYPDDQKAVIATILPTLKTDWCIQQFAMQYAKTVERVEAINKSLSAASSGGASAGLGKPVLQTNFGATLYKVSNQNATSFLKSLRETFPNKAIVLDRWATWCSSCIREL